MARLRVMGVRVLPHLAALVKSPATSRARASALSVLESFDDARAISLALTALNDADADVAIAIWRVPNGKDVGRPSNGADR